MFPVDHPNAVQVRPADRVLGTPGFFSSGDRLNKIPPTGVPTEWLNGIQGALVEVHTAAGIPLARNDDTTFLRSLRALIRAPDGPLVLSDTTASTTTTTGALRVSGGAGIAGTVVAGTLTSAGNIISRASGGEGGQIILAYTGNTAASGQAASTWNIDVDSSNNLRVFRVNSGGTTLVPMSIAEGTGTVTVSAGIVGTLTGNADTATRLATARNIALAGDATGTASFTGAANVSITTTLSASGVTPGTYNSVTVDAKGRVTAGGVVGVGETDTLATVTGRGATTATAISLTNSTASGSTTTGALVIAGGLGVGESVTSPVMRLDPNAYLSLNSGSPVLAFDANDYVIYNRTSNTLATVIGGTTITSVSSAGTSTGLPISVTNGTASTSSTTGALVVSGGVGVGGALQVAGNVTASQFVTSAPDGARIRSGTGATGYGMILRNDGTGFYLLTTGQNDANGPFNALRPLTVNLSTGNITLGHTLNVGGPVNAANFAPLTAQYAIVQGNYISDASAHYAQMLNGTAGGINFIHYYRHIPNDSASTLMGSGSTAFVFNHSTQSAYTAGSWVSGSDGRVKEDRAPITGALDKIEALNGLTYTRTDIVPMCGAPYREAGLIAQDVREVLPEAITQRMDAPSCDPDGEKFLSLNYNAVVALLVEAVKELRAEVAALRATD